MPWGSDERYVCFGQGGEEDQVLPAREALYHIWGRWSQLSSHHWESEVILQQLYNNPCKNKPGTGVWLLARGELACHKSVSTGSSLAWSLIYKPVVWSSAGARLCLCIRCENRMLTRQFRGTPVGRRRQPSLLPAHSSAFSDPIHKRHVLQINRICITLPWLLLLPTGTKLIQSGSKTHY